MPTYRTNVTDAQQDDLELATFEGGVPVFKQASDTKVIAKGLDGSPERTIGKVVVPWNDNPGRFDDDAGKP